MGTVKWYMLDHVVDDIYRNERLYILSTQDFMNTIVALSEKHIRTVI